MIFKNQWKVQWKSRVRVSHYMGLCISTILFLTKKTPKIPTQYYLKYVDNVTIPHWNKPPYHWGHGPKTIYKKHDSGQKQTISILWPIKSHTKPR